MSPGRARQCHQEPSVSSAQPAGLQRPPRVPEEGEGSPSSAPPERLARVGAAQPPSSALLPMAEHADLSRRFPAFLAAAGCAGSWGEAAAEQPLPRPPSQPPSPALTQHLLTWTPPGVHGELGHNQGTGITAQGQAVGGWQSVPSDSSL